MQVTEILNEGLKRQLKITVPAADLDGCLTNKLTEIKDNAQVRGFRPGKVPLAHLRKLYGKSVMAEIVQETVNETSLKALEDRNERPANQPSIELTEDQEKIEAIIDGKGDLDYTMAYEILPEIATADFSKVEIEKPVADIDEDDVTDSINRLAEQSRPYTPRPEGEGAQDGDRLTFDYLGKLDGEPFEGGADQNSNIVIGSGAFIPGFEEGLNGMKAGDEGEVKVTFPEEYQAAHLAGKDAVFEVKIHEVGIPGELELNDELAKSCGMEDMDKLREAIRGEIERGYENRARQAMKRELFDKLDEVYSFELPEQLVTQEFDGVWKQVTEDLERAEKTFEDEDTTEEKAREEYMEIARRRVRLGLALADVGDKNEITVSDDELNRALMERVRQFPSQEQMVWDFYQKNPQALNELRAPVFEDKVVDFILTLSNVTAKEVTKEELFAEPDEEGED